MLDRVTPIPPPNRRYQWCYEGLTRHRDANGEGGWNMTSRRIGNLGPKKQRLEPISPI